MFVARLGNFDFSNYLRVGPGEGLDPYDGDGFLEPAFNEGPFGDGQPLLNVDRRNRMMAWPLYLRNDPNDTAKTNLVTNPSFETGTTGWSIAGTGFTVAATSITQTDDAADQGICSAAVVTNGSANSGVNFPFGAGVTFGSGQPYRIRARVRATSGTPTVAAAIGVSGTDEAFSAQVVTSGAFQDITISWTPSANRTSVFLAFYTPNASVANFYLDSVQVIAESTTSVYFDGDSAGAKWDGTRGESTSSTLVGKDGLHELVQILNREISNPANKPLRLEWRDDDAGESTYYDVAFARFDPDFHFRRSQHGWAAGVLRVWCSPAYGHTGTYRAAASAAGTGAVLKAVIASSPIGDAPALLDAQIQTGSYVDKDGHLTGLSILPHPSYVCDVPAASLITIDTTASLIGASGAAGSQVLGVFNGGNLGSQTLAAFQVALSPASHYEGRNRVLAITRANFLPGVGLRAFVDNHPIGPTAIASQYQEGYSVVDLGVWDVLPRNTQATLVLDVRGGGMPATGNMGIATNYATGHGLRVNRVIVLPEDTTTFVADSDREPVAFDSFDNAGVGLAGLYDQMGNGWASYSTGAPYVASAHGGAVSDATHDAATRVGHGAMLGDLRVTDVRMTADVRLRESADGLGFFELGKNSFSAGEYNVMVGPAASSYLALTVDSNSLIASVALPKSALDKDIRLEYESRGKRAFAAVWFAGSLVASLGASHANLTNTGRPYMYLQATSGLASPYIIVRSLAMHAIPSAARPARHVVHLTASGAEVQDSASVFLRDVAGEQIAQTPQAVPSSAAVAAFSMPLNGGPANSLLGVEVRAQERFVYGR